MHQPGPSSFSATAPQPPSRLLLYNRVARGPASREPCEFGRDRGGLVRVVPTGRLTDEATELVARAADRRRSERAAEECREPVLG